MQTLLDAISQIQVGMPMTFSNLTIFPLLRAQPIKADYLTLDEALAIPCAHITETSEGGSVPELRFANESNKRIFLLDGEELIGAKQNRVLNLSIMVAAGKTIIIPVSCVERGRWHHRSREFSSASRSQYAEGRAKKMAQVTESMMSSGKRISRQGEVWADIDAKFARMKSTSSTSAMSDIFEQQAAHLEEYVRSFPPVHSQAGAVFAINGRVIGFDLFDSTETYCKLLPKLLRSYALDALDRKPAISSDAEFPPAPAVADAQRFLQSVVDAEIKEFPAVGVGQDLRLTKGDLAGAALSVDDQVIHLCAFGLNR